jgi:D-3-phosphoglycerate dehydrogenase
MLDPDHASNAMSTYTVYVPRSDDSVPERDFRRGLDPLIEHPDVELVFRPGREYGDVQPGEVPGANAIIAIQEPVTAELVAALPSLEIVAAFGAGLDHIDVDACTEHGVAVVNAPQPVRDAVAQSTLGMLLSCASNLHGFDARIRRDGFAGRYENMGVTLYGKTVGVVGLGLIGTRLLDLLEPFGVDVLAHDPYLDEDRARALGVERVSLDGLLDRADFVSLHCPLTEDTRGMLGPEEFERMQDTAYLVNAARGGIYADADLAAALRTGELAGAAVDVFEDEPDVDGNPLLALDECLLTPHTSGLLLETTTEQGNMVSEAILRRSRGQIPNNVVNPECYDEPVDDSLRSPTHRS